MSAARRMLGPAPSTVRARGLLLTAASLLLVVLGVRPVAAQTEVIEYYGQDALGSTRIVFDSGGTATARADFEPFGELFTVPNMPGGQLPAQQFTGQERDPEASQDYFGARFYTPRTGRFSQVDPVYAGLFDPQQWNRYAYARNNPLTFTDPTGRQVYSGIPGFCSAENSYIKCGGDNLFWDNGGGGWGFDFGDSYAGALNRGYVPGMSAEIWGLLEENNAAQEHQYNAMFVNGMLDAGNVQGAINFVKYIDPTIVFVATPTSDAHRGAPYAYQHNVDATATALGLGGFLQRGEWTGGGYKFSSSDANLLEDATTGNWNFASGGLGVLHARDTAWPNRDSRSFTGPGMPFSLQVTTGPDGGWMDVDLSNPYQDLASFIGHALEVLHIRRP